MKPSPLPEFLQEADKLLAAGQSIRHILSPQKETPLQYALTQKNHALIEKYIEHCDVNLRAWNKRLDFWEYPPIYNCANQVETLKYIPKLLQLGAEVKGLPDSSTTLLSHFLTSHPTTYLASPEEWKKAFLAIYKKTDIVAHEKRKKLPFVVSMFYCQTVPEALQYVLDTVEQLEDTGRHTNYLQSAMVSKIAIMPKPLKVLLEKSSVEDLTERNKSGQTSLVLYLNYLIGQFYDETWVLIDKEDESGWRDKKEEAQEAMSLIVAHHLNLLYPSIDSQATWVKFINQIDKNDNSIVKILANAPSDIKNPIEAQIEQHILKLNISASPTLTSGALIKITKI